MTTTIALHYLIDHPPSQPDDVTDDFLML